MILLTILFLAFMEVSLSFDNAILNAGVLKHIETKWQHRFLTWGMPVAVFGMRFLFPILIVCVTAHMNFLDVGRLAIYSPLEYEAELSKSHALIDVFGGMFLLMIFLKFICEEKEIYWLVPVERYLYKLGKLESLEIVIALTILIFIQKALPQSFSIFMAGSEGIILYVLVNSFMGDTSKIKSGIGAFLYLEILDASCSFDGVVGAFVLTNNILYIMIGLGIGAACIRSLTLYLVKGGQLDEFIYLEYGAHYAIGALAIIMLTDIFYAVPEPVTGMIGLSFIGLSLLSSMKAKK